MKKHKTAFTLAEVLITLTIIGVVAALTISALVQNMKEQELKAGAKNAFSIFNTALKKAVYDNGNAPIACYYWKKSTYPNAHCSSYDSDGNCSQYQMPDGKNLPDDYNGHFDECSKLMPDIVKILLLQSIASLVGLLAMVAHLFIRAMIKFLKMKMTPLQNMI